MRRGGQTGGLGPPKVVPLSGGIAATLLLAGSRFPAEGRTLTVLPPTGALLDAIAQRSPRMHEWAHAASGGLRG